MRILAAALCLFGASAQAAVVLMYHRVGEDTLPSTSVRVQQFEAHLEHLARAGYRVVPLEELVAALRRGEPLPDRAVAITFDDAYRSVYTEAFPRLRARGYPFTLFVSTESVDRGRRGYLTWHELAALKTAGVTLANHGHRHLKLVERLPGEDEATWGRRVVDDVEHAQQRLEEELGPDTNAAPKLFAYPYGEYDQALADRLAALGYVSFGQHSGAIGASSDLRALPRFPMNEHYGELQDFALKVASLPLPLSRVEPWDPRVDENPPRLRLTLAPPLAPSAVNCYLGRERLKTAVDERVVTVVASVPLPPGRSRYNCTAPAGSGRYHWYSHPWIVPGGRD